MAQTLETPGRRFPRWLPIVVIVVAVLLIVPLIIVILNINSILTFLFDPHRVDTTKIVQCYGPNGGGCGVIHSIVYSLLFFFIVLTGFAYTTLLERKFIAWFQQRVGPNRVGPFGLLQPLADGVKLIFKEDIIPSGADRPVYLIAPLLKTVPTLIVLAVIPLGPDLLIPWFDGMWYQRAAWLG